MLMVVRNGNLPCAQDSPRFIDVVNIVSVDSTDTDLDEDLLNMENMTASRGSVNQAGHPERDFKRFADLPSAVLSVLECHQTLSKHVKASSKVSGI